MSSSSHSDFVSCVTVDKLLNLSELGSHLPTLPGCCADKQVRAKAGGRLGAEEGSGHGKG